VQEGRVANFVETEQMLAGAAGTHAASFVQVRGSIPLYWEQRGYRYRPKIRLSDHTSQMVHAHALPSPTTSHRFSGLAIDAPHRTAPHRTAHMRRRCTWQAKAFILHFEEQLTFYQSQLIINLLDQKGARLLLPLLLLLLLAHTRAMAAGAMAVTAAGAEMELSEAYAGYLRHVKSPKIKYPQPPTLTPPRHHL
jgi:hypothetical protein